MLLASFVVWCSFAQIPHGDSLLFIVSSAQVMYAYVMRPDTLPPSYWNFIVRTGERHLLGTCSDFLLSSFC